MSRRTKEINKIVGVVIAISSRLILLALVAVLLYEGAVRGYAFGHDIFYASSAEAAPGRDIIMHNGSVEPLHDCRLTLNSVCQSLQGTGAFWMLQAR